MQEWGYQSWNHAVKSSISVKDVEELTLDVIKRLDENFFKVRFERLTTSERNFLRAMANLNEGPKKQQITFEVRTHEAAAY